MSQLPLELALQLLTCHDRGPGIDQCGNFLQKNAHVVTIDGYEDVPENDEEALRKAVASQPVSVAIEAGGRDFQLYSGVRISS